MKKLIISTLVLTAFYGNVYAESHTSQHTPAVVSSDKQDNRYTSAVIKKIDKENGKVTLKHEEIKNLDMPGMTMVFKLKLADMSAVDTLNVGDSVKVFFDKAPEGFVVKEIIKIN